MSALDETDEHIPEEGEEEEVKAIEDEEEESEEEDEDDDEYGTVATELSHDRVELLINLFEALDRDNDGKLTVKDFRNLGEVMTGTRPTKASLHHHHHSRGLILVMIFSYVCFHNDQLLVYCVVKLYIDRRHLNRHLFYMILHGLCIQL